MGEIEKTIMREVLFESALKYTNELIRRQLCNAMSILEKEGISFIIKTIQRLFRENISVRLSHLRH